MCMKEIFSLKEKAFSNMTSFVRNRSIIVDEYICWSQVNKQQVQFAEK